MILGGVGERQRTDKTKRGLPHRHRGGKEGRSEADRDDAQKGQRRLYWGTVFLRERVVNMAKVCSAEVRIMSAGEIHVWTQDRSRNGGEDGDLDRRLVCGDDCVGGDPFAQITVATYSIGAARG